MKAKKRELEEIEAQRKAKEEQERTEANRRRREEEDLEVKKAEEEAKLRWVFKLVSFTVRNVIS